MKKIIILVTLLIFTFSINVNASDFVKLTEKLLKYHNIEVTDDVSGINYLQNRRNIKNPEIISAAIKSGVIVAKNGIVNENGEDFSPVTDGLIKRYINDSNYIFISGSYENLKETYNLQFYDKTVYVTENQSVKDINNSDIYTCVVDSTNKVNFIWKAGEIIQPAIYKVKLYWLEGAQLYASQVYRKDYGLWERENIDDNFTMLDASDISVSEGFILENLDKYIYIFADSYGGKIVIKGISH